MALITCAFDKWPSQHASPQSTAATVCSFRPSLYLHVLPFCDRHMCNLVTYVELWKPPHSRTGDQQLQQWQTATYNPILSTLNEAFGGIWKKHRPVLVSKIFCWMAIYLNTIFFFVATCHFHHFFGHDSCGRYYGSHEQSCWYWIFCTYAIQVPEPSLSLLWW